MRRSVLLSAFVALLLFAGPAAYAQMTVNFAFDGEDAGTDAETDGQGAFSAELTVPEDAEGEVTLTAECTGDGSELTTTFTVAEEEPVEEEPVEEEPVEEEREFEEAERVDTGAGGTADGSAAGWSLLGLGAAAAAATAGVLGRRARASNVS